MMKDYENLINRMTPYVVTDFMSTANSFCSNVYQVKLLPCLKKLLPI